MIHIFSLLLGFVASVLATLLIPEVTFFINWIAKKCKLYPKYSIINEHVDKKLFNSVLCLEINDRKFSEIATEYLMQNHNKIILITNVQEPEWFYKKFKKYIEDKKYGCTKIALMLKKYEEYFQQTPFEKPKVDKILNDIIKKYYNEKSDIKIWPHLKQFVISNIENKARISYFRLKFENEPSCKDFKMRNKLHQVYFFEKLINYNTNSIFKDSAENSYAGTDSLILNNKIVLNHNEPIKELSYQDNNLIYNLKKGFFHQVAVNYNDCDAHFKTTSSILKTLYNFNV